MASHDPGRFKVAPSQEEVRAQAQEDVLDLLDKCVEDAVQDVQKYAFVTNAFTRDRKLSIEKLTHLLVTMGSGSIDRELSRAFPDPNERPTVSAFSQALAKLRSSFMEALLKRFNATDKHRLNLLNTLGLGKKPWRLLAVDGTKINVPARKGSRWRVSKKRGRRRKDGREAKQCYQMHANVCMDLLTKEFVACTIQDPRHVNERAALIDIASKIPEGENALFICDRGYSGINVYAWLNEIGVGYVIRSKCHGKTVLRQIDSLPDEELDVRMELTVTTRRRYYQAHSDEDPMLVCKEIKKKPSETTKDSAYNEYDFGDMYHVSIRVVKFRINEPGEGEEWEVLVTNLPEDEFPLESFHELYHLRWGIEVGFRDLKYAIPTLYFHTNRDDGFVLEFWRSLLVHNVARRVVAAAEERKKTKRRANQRGRKTLHVYKVNFKHCCFVLLEAMRSGHVDMDAILEDVSSCVVAVRPGRSDKRRMVPKGAVAFTYRVA